MTDTLTTSDGQTVEIETDLGCLWGRCGGKMTFLTASDLAYLAASKGIRA